MRCLHLWICSVRNLLVRRASPLLGRVVRHGGLVPYSCVRLRYPELCLARPLILRRRLQGYEVERLRWPTPTHWEASQDWEWFFALLGGVELQLSPPQGEPLEETADIVPYVSIFLSWPAEEASGPVPPYWGLQGAVDWVSVGYHLLRKTTWVRGPLLLDSSPLSRAPDDELPYITRRFLRHEVKRANDEMMEHLADPRCIAVAFGGSRHSGATVPY